MRLNNLIDYIKERWGIFGVLVLGLVFLLFSYKLQFLQSNSSASSWMKDFFLNFGSGLIGAVIVILMYDEVQNRKIQHEQKQKQAIIVRKLSTRYRLFLKMAYCDLVGDTKIRNVHRQTLSQIKQIINTQFFEKLEKVNLLEFTNSHKMYKVQAFYYHFQRLQNDVESLLNIYEPYISNDLALLIEKVNRDNILFGKIRGASEFMGTILEPDNFDVQEEMKDHIDSLLELIGKLEESI